MENGLPKPIKPGEVVGHSVASVRAKVREEPEGESAVSGASVAQPGARPNRAANGPQKPVTAYKGTKAAPTLPTDYTAIMGQAGSGVVPDVDGLVQFLLQAGRDAAITSRGAHWSAITDEGIKPVAANLAQALRLAFPDLARSMEKSSPLVAGLAGLGLLIAPVLAYERYMINNAKMAGANVPNNEPTI